MAQMTVEQFATELKVEPVRLLEQLKSAGVHKTALGDILSEQDKSQLLEYLHRVHGGVEPRQKITLTRRQTTEIRQADGTGRSRTIQVEVRKKRVFVKRDATGLPEGEAADSAPEVPAEVVPVAEAAVTVPVSVPEPEPVLLPEPEPEP
ncbi:MAG: translation initiation factor IF-2 associated domain-containing protein, partial [Betaproteobacteria bacterium]